MGTIRLLISFVLASSVLCISSPLRAAVVEPVSLASALGMVEAVPSFRASVLTQIVLVNSLSDRPVPTLSPMIEAAPTPADPWHAEATRLVGALVAQPQAYNARDLRSALGEQGAVQLEAASARLHARAVERPELAAQLEALHQGLDLSDARAVQDFGARLNALFEDSKTRNQVASGATVGGVREGATATDSFARRHARLDKPESRTLKAVPAVDVLPSDGKTFSQAIVNLARQIAPIFNTWLTTPSPERRRKAYQDFLAIDKELSRAESEEGSRRYLLKKQGQAVIQNETVQSALQEWHRQAWLIRQAAGSREWLRLLDWPLEPGLKRKALLQLAHSGNQEKASALWQLVEKFNPHGPTDAVLHQNVEALSGRMTSTLDAWLNASDPGQRLKIQADLKSVNEELDRAEADEIGRRSLIEGRNVEYDEESTFLKVQSARYARNHLVELTEEPDSVFNRLLELPLGPTQRKEAVQSFAEDNRFAPDVSAALVALVQNFKSLGPSNASASIEELYQSDRWKRRLSAPLTLQTYVRNFSAMLPNTSISKYYAVQAAEARARAEMIVTGGRQATRRQSRGTCPYNAACNLFAEQIAEYRLTSKDILREAYRLNPTFASRPGNGAAAVNGLSQEGIIAMTSSLAARVGKKVAEVEPEEIIKFMSAEKTPVMATITSWDEERHESFDHIVVLGNPFIFHDLNGDRSVAFEVYDSNLPKDVITYIDAEILENVMVEKGLALLDSHKR